VSLDGTDFKIYEQRPFDRKWFSHKFHGPGLRYEIGLAIHTGKIVWINGGYPCGQFPDLKIARELYTSVVEFGELTLADLGYRDANFFITPRNLNGFLTASKHKIIMQRHETVNRRFKQFAILRNTFRNKIEKHSSCVRAIANMIQVSMNNGEKLFQID
jgi:hypothetical protein